MHSTKDSSDLGAKISTGISQSSYVEIITKSTGS
jgi:hypothetical protein